MFKRIIFLVALCATMLLIGPMPVEVFSEPVVDQLQQQAITATFPSMRYWPFITGNGAISLGPRDPYWHHCTSGTNCIAIDLLYENNYNGQYVISPDAGTVEYYCGNNVDPYPNNPEKGSNYNVVLNIRFVTGHVLQFLHLDERTIPANIKIVGSKVFPGQTLGKLLPGGFENQTPCTGYASQTDGTAHIHFNVLSSPKEVTFDGWDMVQYDSCFRKEGEDSFCQGLEERLEPKGTQMNCTFLPENLTDVADLNTRIELCRKQALVRSRNNGQNQGIIELFDKLNGTWTPVGKLNTNKFCVTTGDYELHNNSRMVKLTCESTAVHSIYDGYGTSYDRNSYFWANQGDIEEVVEFPTSAKTGLPMTDVEYPFQKYIYIRLAAHLGIYNGYSNGTFGYDRKLSRGEVAIRMYRTIYNNPSQLASCEQIGWSEDSNGKCTISNGNELVFRDVTDMTNEVNRAIQWLGSNYTAELDVNGDPFETYINGYGENNPLDCPGPGKPCFNPDKTIVIGEYMQLTLKALKRSKEFVDKLNAGDFPECTSKPMGDVDDANKFKVAVETLCGLGVYQGRYNPADGKWYFDMNVEVNRRDSAQFDTRLWILREDQQPQFAQTLPINRSTVSETDLYFEASPELLELREWYQNSWVEEELQFVYDAGIDDSYFGNVSYKGVETSFDLTSPKYAALNLEGLALDEYQNIFYAVTGSNADGVAQLFEVNPFIGTIKPSFELVTSDGYDLKGTYSLAYDLEDGKMYTFATEGPGHRRGLYEVDLTTGVSTLVEQSHLVVQDMAWEKASGKLWLVTDYDFYSYAGSSINHQFRLNQLPERTEAITFLPSGVLLVGTHSTGGLNIHMVDVVQEEILATDIMFSPDGEDVEGMVWPSWLEHGYPVLGQLGALPVEIETRAVSASFATQNNQQVVSVREISDDNMFAFGGIGVEISTFEDGIQVPSEFVSNPVVTLKYPSSVSQSLSDYQIYQIIDGEQVLLETQCSGNQTVNPFMGTIQFEICHAGTYLLMKEVSKTYLPVVFR